MGKPWDWNKHSALSGYLNALIGLIGTTAVILITVFIWQHPYSPSVTPKWGLSGSSWVWLSVWAPPLLALGCLTFSFVVYLKARSLSTVTVSPPYVPSSPSQQPAHPRQLASAEGPGELTVKSPEDICVHIKRETSEVAKGFVISVVNNRLNAVSRVMIDISSVQTYDSGRQAFRAQGDFATVRISFPDKIQAAFSTKPVWFVRKDPRHAHLLAGDSFSQMTWPDRDKSENQKWLILAKIHSQNWYPDPTAVAALPVWAISLVITWNSTRNEFYIQRS